MKCGNIQCNTGKRAKKKLYATSKLVSKKVKGKKVFPFPEAFVGVEVLYACPDCAQYHCWEEWMEEGGLNWKAVEAA